MVDQVSLCLLTFIRSINFCSKMLSAFYVFKIPLKMRVFDNKIREHAATYMNPTLLLYVTPGLEGKRLIHYSKAAPR